MKHLGKCYNIVCLYRSRLLMTFLAVAGEVHMTATLHFHNHNFVPLSAAGTSYHDRGDEQNKIK